MIELIKQAAIDAAPLFDWISNQGFAIAVAGYLLIRLEAKVDRLINVIEELCAKLGS